MIRTATCTAKMVAFAARMAARVAQPADVFPGELAGLIAAQAADMEDYHESKSENGRLRGYYRTRLPSARHNGSWILPNSAIASEE